MKITVKLAIELDPELWAKANGMGDYRARDIVDDVRSYVLNLAQQAPMLADEADAEVTITR